MALYTTTFFRWLQLKRYQYEVTFSLYMLTPTEKFIFNSFLFLVLSMIIIAASLYLPEHVAIISQRLYFYWGGDESTYAKEVISNTAATTADWAQSARTVDAESVLERLRDL